MLHLLHIENIAVIEEADISFADGLNVLTGETGAGKSIVIDAISAILGQRTYRDLIRTGCSMASVSAIFYKIPLFPWFSQTQIPYDPHELLIQRDIFADGKNICRVNGRPVTVSVLRELGQELISIHGQHDSQSLFDEQTHLSILDLFLDNPETISLYQQAYESYRQVTAQLSRLSTDESEKLRMAEMLRYQLQEIDSAALEAEEDTELESKRRILRNAERISDSLQAVSHALWGSDDTQGAVAMLDVARKELDRLHDVDKQYADMASSLSDLRYSAQDVAEDVHAALEELSYSRGELERIENRLDVIGKLRKKYGATVRDILQYAEDAREKLDTIELSDAAVERLKQEQAEALHLTMDRGEILTAARKKAAEQLRLLIEEELRQLDMPNICFTTEFTSTDPGAAGLDFPRFLMSANVGEALKPLSKVASGGELARIMLAIKNVLAQRDSVQTLIFDEVDAGVSGRAAQKVAEKLKTVSQGKQVFCVTHLPQIAAMADTHLLISKAVRSGRTYTSVTNLDRQGRVEELSRIIGGSDITENTRKSAEDMLI